MDFRPVVEPIITLVSSIEKPLLIIVGTLGILYCIVLGVKLALAPTRERRANAISHLLAAVVAYFLIFIMIYLIKAYTPALQKWVDGDSSELRNVKIDMSTPIDQASDVYKQSKEIVKRGK